MPPTRRFGRRAPAIVVALAFAVLVAPTGAKAAPGDISTVAGGPGKGAALRVGVQPAGLAVRGSLVYIADPASNTVRKLNTATGILTLVAGLGTSGAPVGDGGPAIKAGLFAPRGVVASGAGDVYIADTGNHRVRKVTPQGTITTVAGAGVGGYSGDGGPAILARLSLPGGLALDGAGNLYIADYNNSRVRRVTPEGIITTVAGLGVAGYSGDGGPAIIARLSYPSAVAAKADGTLYIADTANSRIRKVTPGGTISTVAGTGVAGYSGDGGAAAGANLNRPRGISVDGSGTLLVADTSNNRIRRVSAGVISTVAGSGASGFSGDGGQATGAALSGPQSAALASGGLVMIGDTGNARVRRVNPSKVIATIAGNGTLHYGGDNGPAVSAQLDRPEGLALDAAGNLFVADVLNHRVRKVTPAGTISTIAGTGVAGFSGDGGAATSARLDRPSGLALDGAGNLFVADTGNDRIRRVTPGGIISTVAGNGVAGYSGDGGAPTAARLNEPGAVAVDGAGRLYIADTFNVRVRRVASGVIRTYAGNGVRGFSGDGGQATSASISDPRGLTLDPAGNLYIADWTNSRIRKVAPGGIITTIAGLGIFAYNGDGGPALAATLAGPRGLAFRAGNLYIADAGNNRVRMIDALGRISTVAGLGVEGYAGDGGPAVAAWLWSPSGVAVSPTGALSITDAGNGRIRRVAG